MRQHHPMENPSLAPYNFVFPPQKERLAYVSSSLAWVHREKILAHIWDRWNRIHSDRPLPVRTIVHEILPSLATRNRISDGDFFHEGLPYRTRDILVLSSTLQWFGTNQGNCCLVTPLRDCHPEREFVTKFADEMKRADMVAMFVHTHTDECATRSVITGCRYDPADVSERDRALVDGLMRWLGKTAGREFRAEFEQRKRSAWQAAHERQRQDWIAKGFIKAHHPA